jgi:hypothetical protein
VCSCVHACVRIHGLGEGGGVSDAVSTALKKDSVLWRQFVTLLKILNFITNGCQNPVYVCMYCVCVYIYTYTVYIKLGLAGLVT